MAQNKITRSTVFGSTKQSSDVGATDNVVEDAQTGPVSQEIRTKPNSMQFLGGKATGTVGVAVLAFVLIAYLVYRFMVAKPH